jgi:hypothetical protein
MKLSRFVFIVLLLVFCFLSIPTPASAQFSDDPDLANTLSKTTSRWAAPIKEFQKARDKSKGKNLEQFTSTTILYGSYVLQEAIFGPEVDPSDPSIENIQSSGAIHIIGGYIAQIVTQPPTSSVEYIADLGKQMNPVKPAYAQSTGYQGLSGVLDVWKGFRNIAYAFFVIIFVVVGFMIMFRAKLNPQTVISLQLAIPKLIITLLLITFSYAISGFIIDLIYFTIYLAVNILGPNMIKLTDFTSGQQFLDEPITKIIFTLNPNNIANNFTNSLQDLFEPGLVRSLLKLPVLSGSLINLIVGGAILYSILKLLFQLVMAYVNIILQVIFSPIILLFSALPQTNTFSSWIKNLLANAASFPATAIMIMVGTGLAQGVGGANVSTFTPPFLGSLPGIGDFSKNVIGLGTILLLPKIVTMIQEALKAKSAPVGGAIAEGIGAPVGVLNSLRQSRQAALQRRKDAQYQGQTIGSQIRKNIPGN